jgi:large subunit ribosomal protein L32
LIKYNRLITILNKTLWQFLKSEHQKQKKNSRKATWKRKADKAAQKAFSLANSVLKGNNTTFIYELVEEE